MKKKKVLRKRISMQEDGALCDICRSHDIRFAGRSVFGDNRPFFKCGSCNSGVWTAGTKGMPYAKYVEVEDWYYWEHVVFLSNKAREEMGLAATISGKHIAYDRHIIDCNDLLGDLLEAVDAQAYYYIETSGNPLKMVAHPKENRINGKLFKTENKIDLRKCSDFVIEYATFHNR